MRVLRWILAALLTVVGVATLMPRRSAGVVPQPPAFHLVVVAPPALDGAAEAWIRHRSGEGGTIARVSSVDASGSAMQAEALRDAIREAALRRLPGTRKTAVLLLGDADAIPTFFFEQPDPRLVDRTDPRFASDHPYRLLDDADELPDVALGRIPARSVAEALAILEKVRRYEAAPMGAWRGSLSFVAGEGHFGPADRVLEGLFKTMAETMVPPRFAVTMTYASPTSIWCPPPSALRDVVTERFGAGSLLVNYLGHGQATSLDRMRWRSRRLPTLDVAAVATLSEPRSELPIAFLGCCSTGWFDREDGSPSLAEALLLAPGGPVAVIAGSRMTHPYGTAVFQKNLIRGLLGAEAATLGTLHMETGRRSFARDSDDLALDLVARPIALATRWACSLDELRLMHVRLYNLLGDPLLRIAHPPPEPSRLELRSGALHGAVDRTTGGSVRVVLESARALPAEGPLAGAAPDDPDLERIAAANYPRANRRLLWEGEGTLRDGVFAVPLPSPLPEGAAVLRAAIEAADGSRQWLGAIFVESSAPAQARAGPAPRRSRQQETSPSLSPPDP
ncbi:MAG TPA: C25 family cysteine peptidase [Phycisphaerales bacterium]|nr:C25 family cysteine peptidase [Phycisphaerales bacterium]HMP38077.1 C25 family cysteine peptidase [Phycisphaerales bacterium]